MSTESADSIAQHAQAMWARVPPQFRAMAEKAVVAVQPLTRPLLQQGGRIITHLQSTNSSTLASYSAIAGILYLYMQNRLQAHKLKPRRRLFLAANSIRHSAGAGSDILNERGLVLGAHMLVAARAMEAVEVFSFCNQMRAESFFIDGKEQSSSVAFALRVRPAIFVYDSEVISLQTVRAIARALKDNGCHCAMIAVGDKDSPLDAQYSAVFNKALAIGARARIEERTPENGVASPSTSKYSLFESPNRSQKNFDLGSTPYRASLSSSRTTVVEGGSSGQKDVFHAIGNAFVGVFSTRSGQTQDSKLERALDAQFDNEVSQRTSLGPSGKDLFAL